MDLKELIKLLENRVAHYSQQRESAFQRGDLQLVQYLDEELATTNTTLSQIKSLSNG